MNASQDSHIIYRRESEVFVIQIDRAEKKNALTPAMYRALGDGLKQADADTAIKVILLRGSEDCFTSGNDVKDFQRSNSGEERPSVYFMKTISQTRKPIIAAVGGLAIGIGTTLLLHCDLVYASEKCFLQMPFTRLGICTEAGSSQLLPLITGHQRASELLLFGDRFSAAQANAYGLVNAVLPQEVFLAYAMEKAQQLAALPTDAVQTTKRLLKRAQQPSLNDTIELEVKEFSSLLQTPEAQAIVQAFLSRKNSA